MDITIALATSRLTAQDRAMDVIANNLANTNTPGYRAERMQFSDWIDQQTGASQVHGDKTISYTQDRATWRDTASGPLTHSGNPYDVAISGDGYFTVNTKNGPRLTRDGRFGPLPDGTLADNNGNAVLDNNGKPIKIPPTATDVTITGNGSISSPEGPIGKLGVVQPTDGMRMQAEGGTYFTTSSPTKPVTSPHLLQGAVEDSNVQPMMELSRMIDNQRQFQFVTQLVQAEDDRQQNAIQKLTPQG